MPVLRGRWPIVTTVLIISVGSVFLLLQARHLWFFGDDWMFLLERSISQRPVEDLMSPHNDHWSTVQILIFRALFSVVGLEHYLVFAMLPILAHAAACILFFLVLRRCGVHPWVAVGVTTVMVFLGAGAENLLWSFQVGMVGSAVFGLAALLVLTGTSGRRRLGLLWLLSILSLMTASTAIPMLIWLGSFTLLRDGLRRALALTVPPMIVYAGWFLVWGQEANTGIAKAPLAEVIPMAWRGLSATWDNMSGFAGAGPVIVVGLLSASVVLQPDTDRRTLALSGWVAAVTSYLIFAYSRGELGPDAATASRYAYFGALLMLPSLALALDALRERLQVRVAEAWLTMAVVLGLFVVPGVFGVVNFRVMRDAMTPDLRERVIAASQLARSGQPLLREQVDPVWNASLSAAELRPDDVADALPEGPVSPRARLTASAALQVGAAATSFGLPEATASFVSTETTPSGDCVIGLGAAGSILQIPSGERGAQVRITLSGTDRTTVRLRDADATSVPVELVVGDTTEVYLGVTAPDVHLMVDLPPGSPFTVCGR
jgi:hypothetical protein